jgi:sorbitol-specific phosphotransferase system component IIC
MVLLLIVYFVAGIIQDFFFTAGIRYVTKEKVFLSVLTSFLTVVVSMLVLYNIVTELTGQSGILAIVIYAAGVGTGTFLAMKLRIGSNGK